jgi:hypothetical protein
MSEAALAVPAAAAAVHAAVAVSPLIRMEGVTKTYDAGELAVQALGGIDLAIEAGERIKQQGSKPARWIASGALREQDGHRSGNNPGRIDRGSTPELFGPRESNPVPALSSVR